MFKNVMAYRLTGPVPMDIEELNTALSARRFVEVGPNDVTSVGWVPPASDQERFVHEVAGCWLMTLCAESKLIPGAYVKRVLQMRMEEEEARCGYKPGRKQKKEMEEAIRAEMLPRAFTGMKRIRAWIDPARKLLLVDAASSARAEDFLELLRITLDKPLPLALIRTERSPVSSMADWLAGGEAPENFTIDQDCELKSVSEDKAAVRYVRHSLDGEDVREHLTAGKLPTKLALTYSDRISFVVTEKMEIKRIDLLDIVVEKAMEDAQPEDRQAVFDAEFALYSAEIGLLIEALIEAFGGELKEDKAAEQAEAA